MARDSCLICQIISGRVPSKRVYEDDTVLAVLDVNGASPGHCFIMPKEHYPIIEQVPDIEIGKIFNVANKISTSVFESLQAQGTNIFVANGIPAGQTVAHFMVNVIPRFENDGIDLQWEPKQLDEEEMSTVELKLKDYVKNIGGFETEEKKEEIGMENAPSKSPVTEDDEEDDYFSKQMERVP